jgi:hypothetical protein
MPDSPDRVSPQKTEQRTQRTEKTAVKAGNDKVEQYEDQEQATDKPRTGISSLDRTQEDPFAVQQW